MKHRRLPMELFELFDGRATKFWGISISGSTLTYKWGLHGRKWQEATQAFNDPATALAQKDMLIKMKLRRGYRSVTS